MSSVIDTALEFNATEIIAIETSIDSFSTTELYTSTDTPSSSATTVEGGEMESMRSYLQQNWWWILSIIVGFLILVIIVIVIWKRHQFLKEEEEEENKSAKIRKEASNTVQLTGGLSSQSDIHGGGNKEDSSNALGGHYRKDTDSALAGNHDGDDYYFTAMSQKNHAQEALKEDLEVMSPDSERNRGATDAQIANMLSVLPGTIDLNDSDAETNNDANSDHEEP